MLQEHWYHHLPLHEVATNATYRNDELKLKKSMFTKTDDELVEYEGDARNDVKLVIAIIHSVVKKHPFEGCNYKFVNFIYN